jgi:hypothetical protein
MPQDAQQPKKENEAIQLQRLDGNAGGSATGKRFDVEYAKAKHAGHGTVGHEEGEVAAGEEEVDEEGGGEEACPHDYVFVEGLEGHGFFASFFAVVGLWRCC